MRSWLTAVLLLAIPLASCQHAPTCASGLVEILQNHKGKKIEVFLGGAPEANFSGTVIEINPASNTLTLEHEYTMKTAFGERGKDAPTSTFRAKYFIDMNRINAISIDEK